MSLHGKRARIALFLLLLFALAGCGPRVPDLTTGATPAGTAGTTVQPTEPTTEPASPSDSGSQDQPTETTDATVTDSPTATDTPTPSESTTSPTSSGNIPTIDCTSDVPASSAPQATPGLSSPPNDTSTEKPDLSVVAPQKCAVGLGSPPETDACLFVWVDLRSQGQGFPWVQLRIESKSLTTDAGLSVERTLEAGPEPKPTELQTNIRPTDLGQTHDVTFTADPENVIEETDENNNATTVTLNLPAREALSPSAVCPAETVSGGGPVPEGGPDNPSSPAGYTETAAAGG